MHPYPKAGCAEQYLSERWRKHLAEYGQIHCGPVCGRAVPIRGSRPIPSRRDSWPPNGGAPGSDVDFIRQQLLDPYNIAYGVLEPLLGGNTSRNLDEAAALCSAMNDWQAQEFVDPEPRLRASILVPAEDPGRRGRRRSKSAPATGGSARSSLARRPSEPLGRRRYWPIFEAALAHGLSIGLHIGGTHDQRAVGRRLAAVLHRRSSDV